MTLSVLDATFDVSVIGLPIAIALHFLVIYEQRKRSYLLKSVQQFAPATNSIYSDFPPDP